MATAHGSTFKEESPSASYIARAALVDVLSRSPTSTINLISNVLSTFAFFLFARSGALPRRPLQPLDEKEFSILSSTVRKQIAPRVSPPTMLLNFDNSMELGNKEKKKIYISCAPIYQWKNIKTYSLYLIVHRLVIVNDRSRSKSFCRKVFGNNSMMRIEEKEREVSVVYPSRIPHLRCRIVGEGNRKEKIRAHL